MVNPNKIVLVASAGILGALVTEHILPGGTITIKFKKRFFNMAVSVAVVYTLATLIK